MPPATCLRCSSLDHPQVLVCGTDGFVDTWAGAIERVYDENGKKKKVQGTVRGILKTVGFTEDMVYKY